MIRAFNPRLPVYFIASRDFVPVVSRSRRYEFAIAFTSKEVAELYIVECKAVDSLAIMIVEDQSTYVALLEFFKAVAVQHICWNPTVRSRTLMLTTVDQELSRLAPSCVLFDQIGRESASGSEAFRADKSGDLGPSMGP